MNGEFTLKTSKGDVQLKVTKLTFYNFEKLRGESFLTSFADMQTDGQVKVKAAEVLNLPLQVNLARLAQTNTRYSNEHLVDIADSMSLMELVVFALSEYIDIRGLSTPTDPEEASEKN